MQDSNFLVIYLFIYFYLFICIRPQASITQQPKHTETHPEYLQHTHTHTQNRKIEYYIDVKQLTACTNLLGQDLSLLTNIVFALSMIVLQLGSLKSISIAEMLLNLS